MTKKPPGLKQADITNCQICGQGLMTDHQMVAYRITIDTLVFDLGAIQRQHGMEQMMGAAAGLAQHMGPDEDMAKGLDTTTALVCMGCAMMEPIAPLLDDDA